MKDFFNSTAGLIVVTVVIGVVLLLGIVLTTKEKVADSATLPITVEEFGDFQCPACGTFYPITENLKAEFGDKINFEFKHFPLEGHDFAYDASVAAEAAREQGKFDEYYNVLFPNQENLAIADLESYAVEIGLDLEKFKADMQSESVRARVDADRAEGDARNVNATPTYFIDGKRVSFPNGTTPEQRLRELIQERINLAEGNV